MLLRAICGVECSCETTLRPSAGRGLTEHGRREHRTAPRREAQREKQACQSGTDDEDVGGCTDVHDQCIATTSTGGRPVTKPAGLAEGGKASMRSMAIRARSATGTGTSTTCRRSRKHS